MKQIVTTKEEKYIELSFNLFTKVVVLEDSEMLFKLNLLGAESPVTFEVEITENDKADLQMFLSTENKEPNEMKNQKHVERMRKFKFNARNKAHYFEIEETCYIMMKSF